MKFHTRSAYLLLSLLGLSACQAQSDSILGFDVSNATISPTEIHRGGPPPDGIPSIDAPKFTPAGEVDFLQDDDIVLGYSLGDQHRAYPFRILIWHEIVNDEVGGKPVMATYCPLCGTAMLFSRELDDRVLTFGVSGLLYNSDVLMFDRETRSLWSQLGLKAVAGPQVGTELEWLPSEQMTWAAWRGRYPEGEVLNTQTGHRRDYVNLPYGSYFNSPRTMFPYHENSSALPAKAWVAGVRVDGSAKAFSIESMPSNQWIEDRVGETTIRVRYTPDSESFEAQTPDGSPIPVVHAFWFAWQAFNPRTELFK